jgi:hypothetical protein
MTRGSTTLPMPTFTNMKPRVASSAASTLKCTNAINTAGTAAMMEPMVGTKFSWHQMTGAARPAGAILTKVVDKLGT